MLGCITDDFTGATDLANTYLGMTKLRAENYTAKAAVAIRVHQMKSGGNGRIRFKGKAPRRG